MINLGILGTADIAYNRFLPAVLKSPEFNVVGVAKHHTDGTERVQRFTDTYNIRVFNSFEELLAQPELDAVYLPIPPATHFYWAERVLNLGLHAYVEKPFTTNLRDTDTLLQLAEQKGLVVFENYMFQYHSQLDWLREQLAVGLIGELRLIRSSFSFPLRSSNDFRYKKDLGGGALLDAGGYVVRLACQLMKEPKLVGANLRYLPSFEVDMQGTIQLLASDGVPFQGYFCMDSFYQCSVELIGSKGKLSTNRVFTAPPNYSPRWVLETQGEQKTFDLPADDHFFNAIRHFRSMIGNPEKQSNLRREIRQQAILIEAIRNRGTEE